MFAGATLRGTLPFPHYPIFVPGHPLAPSTAGSSRLTIFRADDEKAKTSSRPHTVHITLPTSTSTATSCQPFTLHRSSRPDLDYSSSRLLLFFQIPFQCQIEPLLDIYSPHINHVATDHPPTDCISHHLSSVCHHSHIANTRYPNKLAWPAPPQTALLCQTYVDLGTIRLLIRPSPLPTAPTSFLRQVRRKLFPSVQTLTYWSAKLSWLPPEPGASTRLSHPIRRA